MLLLLPQLGGSSLVGWKPAPAPAPALPQAIGAGCLHLGPCDCQLSAAWGHQTSARGGWKEQTGRAAVPEVARAWQGLLKVKATRVKPTAAHENSPSLPCHQGQAVPRACRGLRAGCAGRTSVGKVPAAPQAGQKGASSTCVRGVLLPPVRGATDWGKEVPPISSLINRIALTLRGLG